MLKRIFLLVLCLIAAQSAHAQSQLALAVQALTPGTWTEFTAAEGAGTNWNSGSLLSVTGGAGDAAVTWSNKLLWNPATGEMFFLGGGHCGAGTGCANSQSFFKYNEANNSWSSLTTPSSQDGHTYHHNTINTITQTFYHRQYDSDSSVFQYNIGTGTWSSFTAIPTGTNTDCCDALEFFPARNSLISVDGDFGIYEYTFATPGWNCLFSGNLTSCGATHTLPNQYVFAAYDNVRGRMYVGGNTNVYAITTAGVISTLTSPPFGIGSNTALSPVTVDPATGNMLSFNGSNYFLSDGTSWTNSGTTPFSNPVTGGLLCGPLPSYKAVMCIYAGTQSSPVSGAKVYLWKSVAASNSYGLRTQGVNVPSGSSSVISTQRFETTLPTCAGFPCNSWVAGGNSQASTQHYSAGTPSLDCTQQADEFCSMKFTVANGSFQGDAGWYDWNFASNYASGGGQYGAGQEVFVQYKIRLDPGILGVFSGAGGLKHDITTEGDTSSRQAGDCSNSPAEVVTIQDNTASFSGPWMYVNCGFSGGTSAFMQSGYQPVQLPSVSSNFLDQDAAGQPHYANQGITNATDPPGFLYVGNEWFTVQKHIKVGTFGQPSSVIEQWMAHAGQPSVLVNNAVDAALVNDGSGGASGKYGKIQLSTYDTGATFNVATAAWFDDLLVSTRRIPDPDTAVPNAPDSLSLAVGSSSIIVSWRVNSNNGTSQDDTGFLVERCTGSASNCFPNKQLGFSQISTTAAHASSFTDSSVVNGTTYTYRVRATNASGNSAYTAAVCFNGGATCGGTAVAQSSGGGPVVSMSPSPVSFGSVLVGTSSSPITVTVNNTGSSTLTLSSPYFAFSGTNPNDFTNSNGGTCANSGTVAAGASCTMTVVFSPSISGAESATLTINGNATGTDSLTGTGIAPVVSLTPSPVAFPNQAIGTVSSVLQTMTLSNTGTANLTLSTPFFSLSGANPGDFAVCTSIAGACTAVGSCSNGGSLAPSSSCTMLLTFSPTLALAESAIVTINGNATGTDNVTGTGVQIINVTGVGKISGAGTISIQP